ncbi:membrane protein [Lysobacter arseniciresistens ZS79]|uniref:Probable membrane transporter protein n=1 Tax=Lysobacter arseniciresistens ZS79 TaxID=913325 RepID=A0A0A0EUG5_9GAMM|nr:TSUP family transporter [Lysobacter arseniciresistens]KGM54576.1 membrane protein [Lysobacter arseniciresistens ZS79]
MELGIEVIALLMAVAFVAGVIDAIAGGGGLLTIPALMAAGVPPVHAIATNKLQSSFGTASAVVAFARKGRIDFRRFARPAVGAFIGSAVGAWVLQRVDPAFLAGLIPVLLILMVIYFTVAPKASEEDRHSRLGAGALVGIVTVIGFYDGFFGPGTGSFLTTVLVALFGMGLVSATAHTKFLNLASNVAALVTLVIGGQVLWAVGLVMAVASIAGGQVGAHLALRVGGKVIRPLLVVMALALTLKLLADPDNPLAAWLLG